MLIYKNILCIILSYISNSIVTRNVIISVDSAMVLVNVLDSILGAMSFFVCVFVCFLILFYF